MRQSCVSHETVYYSTPVAGFSDMSVLVCSARWSVTALVGGHKIWLAFQAKAMVKILSWAIGAGAEAEAGINCYPL